MASADPRTSWRDRAMAWLLGVATLLGTYLVLSGKASGPECAAGLVAAILGTVASAAVAGNLPAFRPRPGWFALLLGRLPAKAVGEAVRVLAATTRALVAGRAIEGEFVAVPFDVGGDDPRSEARRALAIAGASLPPNSVVVAIDRDRRLLLFHRLVVGGPAPGGGDREWPL